MLLHWVIRLEQGDSTNKWSLHLQRVLILETHTCLFGPYLQQYISVSLLIRMCTWICSFCNTHSPSLDKIVTLQIVPCSCIVHKARGTFESSSQLIMWMAKKSPNGLLSCSFLLSIQQFFDFMYTCGLGHVHMWVGSCTHVGQKLFKATKWGEKNWIISCLPHIL